jgi:hypothetical protein
MVKAIRITETGNANVMKFVDVEKHYQELNQEERKIIESLAKDKIQELAKENTK